MVSIEKVNLTPEKLREGLAKTDLPNLWKPSPNSLVALESLPQLGTGKPDLVGIREGALQELGGAKRGEPE